MHKVKKGIAIIVCGALVSEGQVRGQEARFDDQVALTEQIIDLQIDQLDISAALKQRLSMAISIDPRIVGGTPASIDDNLWQVALIRGQATGPSRFQFCGGSLIADTWVLTAAHCLDGYRVRRDPTRVDIVAGTDFFPYGGERIKVAELIIHPDYDQQNNDIALLKLERPSVLGEPISIASSRWTINSSEEKARVTGWGAIDEGGPGSNDLLGVELPVVSNAQCNEPESYGGTISETMLCAGEREGGLDACQGDSGGPLTQTVNGKRLLIGVVSWGDGCGRQLKYGVYTRVPRFTDWIGSYLGSP
ncbi:MAG: serine protease [Pseudomonadota bacterium]